MARFFAVLATDKPGMREVREWVRPVHRTWLRQYDAMNGTLLVVEAERIDDVMEFVGNDPYMQAGLFDCVEIRPSDWSLGNPERRV
ncbi:YciI family protein [Paraburkholderia sp. MM5384-R2]|uniref:YciI family protein n=1 Tax=Paraburkholderia sp. MM5384-R2 TaxID=2723097 RepID=UPI00160A9259|nr:YciI family protein [Paraburkholderia sp. MM5384-R2]MBB5496917.1 hypothetical protein [Paraburkholderia sp. MM5384-R2]